MADNFLTTLIRRLFFSFFLVSASYPYRQFGRGFWAPIVFTFCIWMLQAWYTHHDDIYEMDVNLMVIQCVTSSKGISTIDGIWMLTTIPYTVHRHTSNKGTHCEWTTAARHQCSQLTHKSGFPPKCVQRACVHLAPVSTLSCLTHVISPIQSSILHIFLSLFVTGEQNYKRWKSSVRCRSCVG